VGGLITPSRIMPFAVLESLVKVSSASSGHPLILRAILSNGIYLLGVPLPASNMFLNVLAIAPGPSLYLWYCLSAAAESMVSRGLQPTPTSACLGTLPSYPDWEEFDSTFFSATSPQHLPGGLGLPRHGVLRQVHVTGEHPSWSHPPPVGSGVLLR